MIVKIIVVVFVIILIEGACELIYKHTPSYKKSQEQNRRIKNVPNNLDVVNIGSGPAYYGFDYDFCDKRGYNLATAPQNFTYGYKLLKHYSKKINKDAIILITIMAPMSFGENRDVYRNDYADKFYGVLKPEEIDNYSVFRRIVIALPFLSRICKRIKNVFSDRTNVEIKSVVDIWKQEFELNDLQDASQADMHSKTFADKVCLVKEMIEYCYSQSWHPVLVIPPVPAVTRKHISEQFTDVFVYNNITKILRDYSNLICLDYYSDDLFDSGCFKSSIFLNNKGKELFSKKVFADIGINKGE